MEIPVSNVKPGTVAVLVHPDGTEEIVKNSLPTEDGIQLTVNGSATVKIVDNSKDFIDTREITGPRTRSTSSAPVAWSTA